jgi:PAS domain S-box-containing protein
MTSEKLDPKVLGQLLLMQSLLNNLPDQKSIFGFVCKGLSDIPGIRKVVFYENNYIKTNEPLQISYPVYLSDSYFGELALGISDFELFKPYEEYLENFIFMIGIILEERKQRQIIEQHQHILEQRIQERTQELTLEKEKLIESQRRFTDLMKNIKLLSIMLDIEGNIIFCNNYFLSVTKYTVEDVIGKNLFEIFYDKKQMEIERQEYRNSLIGLIDFPYNTEKEIKTKTGEKLIISWNNTLLRDSDKKIIGSASIGENITERRKTEQALIKKKNQYKFLNEEYLSLNKKLSESLDSLKNINSQLETAKEKAEESDRLKTAFLQNMSHEIRTPMNAIMGFASILVDQYNNKTKLEKYSHIIYQRSNDLLSIINDILDIAKIESGQLTVHIEKCSIKELFDDLTLFFNEYKTRINKSHISLNFTIDKNQDDIINSDKTKLKQIFINLISNALKFTDDGTVECGCKLNDGTLTFYVSDTGMGIPLEKQELIFERFTQLPQNKFTNVGGTGLGLSIVKGLIDLLGGEIWLKSQPGKGSTFSFKLSL